MHVSLIFRSHSDWHPPAVCVVQRFRRAIEIVATKCCIWVCWLQRPACRQQKRRSEVRHHVSWLVIVPRFVLAFSRQMKGWNLLRCVATTCFEYKRKKGLTDAFFSAAESICLHHAYGRCLDIESTPVDRMTRRPRPWTHGLRHRQNTAIGRLQLAENRADRRLVIQAEVVHRRNCLVPCCCPASMHEQLNVQRETAGHYSLVTSTTVDYTWLIPLKSLLTNMFAI